MKNATGANLNLIEMNDRLTDTLRSLGAPAKRRKEERVPLRRNLGNPYEIYRQS
jgi:hypothetical protein